jgi:hypothetical protein
VSEGADTNGGTPPAAEEESRYLPVHVPSDPAPALDVPGRLQLPAPVVAATGGLIAGFVTFMLVRVLRARGVARPAARRRALRKKDRVEIAGSRSFLVDVHVLKR